MHKIKQIELNKLFGYEKNNYTVNLLDDSPLTFIYAFNGIGKTTLFKLIDAAIKRKMTVLDSIIFESLRITFDTNETLTVKKLFLKHFDDITMGELPNDENKYYFPIIYEWYSPGEEVIVGKHYFEEHRSEEINLLLEEDFDTYSKMPYSWKTDKGIQRVPLSIFYKRPIVEEFIDRREIENNLLNIGVNILYANKDYNRIAAAQSSRLEEDDVRFNFRISIFENYKTNDIIPLEIKSVRNALQKREDEINMMSDISWKEFSDPNYDSKQYDAETKFVYFNLPDKITVIQEKIKYFLFNEDYKTRLLLKATIDGIDPNQIIEKKITLFESVINDKACLTDKNIFINRRTGGIEIKLDFEEGAIITPENLSSGEKNVLLLYFHLIFLVPDNCPENSAYIELIDEPEVSMHPDWLINFIESLKYINEELGRGDNIQFIVATHSPAITYANSNLMVEMRRA